MGKSPRHARNIALVLNPRTGIVSPQFHIKYEDTFETVRGTKDSTHGIWLNKCGFHQQQSKSTNMDKHQKIDDRKEIVQNEKDIMDNFDNDESVPYDLADELPDDLQEQPRDGMPQNEGEIRPAPVNVAQGSRRSQRAWKPTTRMLERVQKQDIKMQSVQEESEYDQDYVTMIDDVNPMTLMSQIDKDTMYFDQAMKQPDSQQFL